jgi:hypothetical protein
MFCVLVEYFIIRNWKDKQYSFPSNWHEIYNYYMQVWPDYLIKKELSFMYHVILTSVL